MTTAPDSSVDRRTALVTAVAAGGLLVAMQAAPPVHAAGTDRPLKVGLIGCGARGSGAAAQAIATGMNVRLTAIADAFPEKIEQNLALLMRGSAGRYNVDAPKTRPGNRPAAAGLGSDLSASIDVPPERRFAGLDAYRKVVESDVDIVILTGPPGYRPLHFEAAVAAGKHVFLEKPLATDPVGVRRVLAAAEAAKAAGLKVGVGLQRHHQASYVEAIRRIHAGEIGDVLSMRCFWNSGPPAKTPFAKTEGMSELEYQVRNWYFFHWLSGDHICEQHIHNIDVCNWAKGGRPIAAEGMGGRQVRTGKEYGNIFDHHAVIYTYEDGTTLHSYCRQIPGCLNMVGEEIVGTTGRADLGTRRVTLRRGRDVIFQASTADDEEKVSPYQVEWNDFVAAIRADTPYNEAFTGAESTLTAILGRLATYSGRQVTWDQAMKSEQAITTDAESWDAEPPVRPDAEGRYPVAVPGATKVV